MTRLTLGGEGSVRCEVGESTVKIIQGKRSSWNSFLGLHILLGFSDFKNKAWKMSDLPKETLSLVRVNNRRLATASSPSSLLE
jgi:hypothetical protein